MKVDKTLVDKLANLSKLEFDEKEQDAIIKNLSDMLDFVGKLDEVDVEGIAPLIYMNSDTNVMRPDEPHMEITKEEALKNAPLADSDYFKVPKVIRKK
ncbi:MAG: Asp-tRNA(Asn)/Glu-tRNA(Gln) amidotransferase subunit GatC [Bacteroidetes bacterium]|jgi:aspartyl-tRNA(Asn)/glutamyl-tRNA(Gln) amidotransferase subunit C|nr:Asp-tRNA(Asn)/Glu-tRNA(Gln) amidotransferase subunit GatC [Bacteroidota bacterium]